MQDEVNEKSVTKSVGSSSKSAAFDGGKLLQKRKVSVIIFMRKGGGNMTVTVDDKRCIGCGMCAAAGASHDRCVFQVIGRVSTVLSQPAKERFFRVLDAANGCPVNAIQAERR